MRSFPPAVAAHLAARKGMLVHALVWITARDRDTGAPESIGLWTGADHQVITVDGGARTYYGVGALIGLEDLVTNAQMEVRTWNMQFSPLHAQVIEAIRVYDARLAPVEMHLWYHDPLTDLPLADPVREFRGTVMEVQITTPPGEGEAGCTVTCVSDAWRLTRGLTVKRSDAALQLQHPGDGFRRWNTISGAVETAWGERIRPAQGETPPVRPLLPINRDRGGR